MKNLCISWLKKEENLKTSNFLKVGHIYIINKNVIIITVSGIKVGEEEEEGRGGV